jgi:hypothetical protein
MTRALIIKELRQHWLPFLLIACLMVVGYLLAVIAVAATDSGSLFQGLLFFLQTVLLLGILVLCNRLVVCEYHSRTQLFVESLPVSRSRMIMVKYLLGLALVWLSISAIFVFSFLISLQGELLTARFLAIMAARAYTFGWCLYTFFFMMGLMGRYRVAIYILCFVGLFALDTLTEVELARFGPFVLVNGRFAFERILFPQQALLVTLGIGLGFFLLTLILSLIREGTVATLLAEKMTHREKITVTVVILAFLFTVSLFDENQAKQPFDLQNAVSARQGEVIVEVSSQEDDDGRGQQFAQLIADEVSAMQAYLGLANPPRIFVTQWSALDPDRFERADLENAEGLLVRANFHSEQWEDGRFLSWLLRELLIVWSEERLQWEPNLWLLDGFSVYWTCRDGAGVQRDRRQLELRAAYGRQQRFSSLHITEWLRYRERVGEDIAAAVAWRGLETLRVSQGEQRFRAFLRAAMDCSVPADIRGMLQAWFHPVPDLLKQHGGLSYPDFFTRWSGDLDELAYLHRIELAQIPRISGEVLIDSMSDYTRMVHFHFQSRPLPDSGRFTLMYAELPAFAASVEPSEIRREDVVFSEQSDYELPGTFRKGTRLYSTFATRVETLGCEIVSGWTRLEME